MLVLARVLAIVNKSEEFSGQESPDDGETETLHLVNGRHAGFAGQVKLEKGGAVQAVQEEEGEYEEENANQRNIKKQHSVTELCKLVLADGSSFQSSNAAFALHRMARLSLKESGKSRSDPGRPLVSQALIGSALQALDGIVLAKADAFEMWDVSLSLWGFSSLGHYNQDVFQRICFRGATLGEETLKPVDCAQIMTAFGRFEHYHPVLLRSIIMAVLCQLEDCKPHEVSQVIWGLARLGTIPPNEVKTLCEAVMDVELVVTLWSLSKLRQKPSLKFMQRMEDSLMRLMPYLGPQDVANSLHSFVKLRYKPSAFMSVAPHFAPALLDFQPNEMSQVLYAYTQARQYSRQLLNASAPVIASRILQLSNQDVVMALWSYGVFLHHPANWRGSDAQMQQLVSELEHRRPAAWQQLLEWRQAHPAEVEKAVKQSPFVDMLLIAAFIHIDHLTPQGLSLTMKAFARLGCHPGHPLVVEIAEHAEQQISQMQTDDITSLLFGLSAVGYDNLAVYYACVRQCIRMLEVPKQPNAEGRPMNFYALNSVVKSCRLVGYTPWTLLDFAESRGIRLKQVDTAGQSLEDDSMSLDAFQVPLSMEAAAESGLRRSENLVLGGYGPPFFTVAQGRGGIRASPLMIPSKGVMAPRVMNGVVPPVSSSSTGVGGSGWGISSFAGSRVSSTGGTGEVSSSAEDSGLQDRVESNQQAESSAASLAGGQTESHPFGPDFTRADADVEGRSKGPGGGSQVAEVAKSSSQVAESNSRMAESSSRVADSTSEAIESSRFVAPSIGSTEEGAASRAIDISPQPSMDEPGPDSTGEAGVSQATDITPQRSMDDPGPDSTGEAGVSQATDITPEPNIDEPGPSAASWDSVNRDAAGGYSSVASSKSEHQQEDEFEYADEQRDEHEHEDGWGGQHGDEYADEQGGEYEPEHDPNDPLTPARQEQLMRQSDPTSAWINWDEERQVSREERQVWKEQKSIRRRRRGPRELLYPGDDEGAAPAMVGGLTGPMELQQSEDFRSYEENQAMSSYDGVDHGAVSSMDWT
eukprot:gene3813-13885_t